MKHDAKKLRQIRESMGMTQEKLSILSNVSERTVQRAEAGNSMSLDVLSDFAAALEVPLSELVFEPDRTQDADASFRRVKTGRALMDELVKAGVASFDCEVDPQDDELSHLLAIVRMIEPLLPSPWEMDQRPAASATLETKITLAADMSRLINALTPVGIGVFASASWINARYPRYDMDEGVMCTSGRQRFERVSTLQLLVCRSPDEKIYRSACTAWPLDIEPKPVAFDTDFDDDVPF
jgi:transcriptional regulator with XRE-family HTH domain